MMAAPPSVVGKTGIEGGKAVIGVVEGGKVAGEGSAIGKTVKDINGVRGEGSVIGKTGIEGEKAIAGVEGRIAGSDGGTDNQTSKAQIFSGEP